MDATKIKVACIGDSITAGLYIEETTDIYPYQLECLLGNGYEVNLSLSCSGAAVWHNGPQKEYKKTIQYEKAKSLGADILVACLGTNDTVNEINETFIQEFKEDYKLLISEIKEISPNVEIFLCLIPPIFGVKLSTFADSVPTINRLITEVARSSNSSLIDLNTPFLGRDDLFSDGLHPNEQGAKLIAETVYNAIKIKSIKL